MAKFNVGDKVILKPRICCFYDIPDNTILTITAVKKCTNYIAYFCEETSGYAWKESDFEDIKYTVSLNGQIIGVPLSPISFEVKYRESINDIIKELNNMGYPNVSIIGSKKDMEMIISNKENSEMKLNTTFMPEIANYTYDSKIGLTIIKWCDGTKTVVKAENPDTADQYTGFVTAYAKKAAENNGKINNLYDKWTVRIPKLRAKHDKMAEKMKTEEAQKEERNRKKKEKYIIRKMALQRKREFEARKLASEKYGISEDEDLT